LEFVSVMHDQIEHVIVDEAEITYGTTSSLRIILNEEARCITHDSARCKRQHPTGKEMI
jgi:hypothetical protein